jgi:hypothetical protein
LKKPTETKAIRDAPPIIAVVLLPMLVGGACGVVYCLLVLLGLID